MPISIKVFKIGDIWYGLLLDFSLAKIYKLTFGTSLSEPPILSNLENPGGLLNGPFGLDVILDNGNIYAYVCNLNNNRMVILRFTDINASPDETFYTIPTGNSLSSISFAKECDTWYGLLSVFGNRVYRLKLGADLFDSPDFTEVTGFTFTQATGAAYIIDGGKYFGFVQLLDGTLIRLDFDATGETDPVINNLNNLSGALAGNSWGIEFYQEESSNYGFVVNRSSNRIDLLNFNEVCNASIAYSTEIAPEVNYSTQGDYDIVLKAVDASGNFAFTSKNTTITEFTAPDIDFTTESSLCVTTPVTFVPQNISGDIITYNWDFEQETSILESPEVNFNVAQVYNVVLDVANTNCMISIEKQIEIFEEPIPNFNNPIDSPCSSEELTFTNTSANIPGTPGVISYLWDFSGEGTSTDESPTFNFELGGLKSISLKTTIPGCERTMSKSLNVLEGPSVDFSFNDICFEEPAKFINLTTGTDITGYSWQFGDGNNSTIENPTNNYNTPGDFEVALTVTNLIGCSTTITKTISVHALPAANFINDQACIGPVQFTDATTVQSANITEWQWDFGNGEFSEEQNPIAQYAQNADFTIQLTTTSNFGCVDDVSKNVSVLSAPTPAFSYIQGCLGEPTLFNDETIIADINPVNSYFWEIEDEVYTEMNPSHTFNTAGNFTATMTVTTANTCTVVASQEIIIPALPIPNFTYTTACANSVITFEDQTVDEGDPIISRTWDFDGLSSANGPLTQFTFSEPGNYNIGLTTRSTLGCTAFVGKTIQVNEQPVAGFGSSSTFGPPPLSVNFTNQSEDAVSFAWLLNDTVDPFSTDEHAALVFEEEGDFEVTLVAFNEFGCADTLKQVIEVAFPAVDLVLDEVIPVVNNGKINIVIRGANRGTLTIEGFDILIDIDGIPTIESFEQQLLKAQPFVHTLSSKLPEDSNIELLCVQLELIDVEEPNTDNNLGCINFEPQIIVQDPFPNPVVETVRLNVVLPDVNDNVDIDFMNIYGEVLISESFTDITTGLNIFDIDVQRYQSGLYLVRIRYDGTEEVRRIRKE